MRGIQFSVTVGIVDRLPHSSFPRGLDSVRGPSTPFWGKTFVRSGKEIQCTSVYMFDLVRPMSDA